MFPKLTYGTVLVALICIAVGSVTNGASAITVEVAKKCQTLSDKAYPLRVPGNPAAGRAKGTARDFRNYFNKCVANGGNMEQQAPKEGGDKDGQGPKNAK